MASRPGRALLRFLALGALLLAGSRWLAPGASQPDEIVIGPDELAAVRAEGLSLLGRPPQGAELAALVEARARDEILYREALARGLDREDAAVRRRLVRNLAFLRGGPEPAQREAADEEALYREALALGMDRSDTVVRRILVQRVKLEIEAPARAAEPTDAELHAFLAAHPERGRGPRRAAFSHLFFDPARRGGRAEAEARAALAALASGAPAPAADPCLAAREQPLQSESLVARLLGPAFAADLFGAPPGVWSGPLRSSLGWHAVRVEVREEGAPLPFGAVRSQLRDALLAERAAAALEGFLTERRASYRVRVLPPETAAAR